ncbi:MAG: carbohydrate ABC transporter substrate-binding protein [Clostridiales bacterium]|nr:carbohydrate ABC transporter substrate-binding protein [Candidatus Blautia equi]
MRRFGKMISLLLAAALTFGMTGCGNSNQEETLVIEKEDPTELTFSWWGNDERHFYTLDALKLFEEKNADINVKGRYSVWNGFEKRMNTYMKSHTEADVMQINFSWIDLFSPEGDAFYDLYELTDVIHLDTFEEGDLKYGEVDGKLNAVPVSFNTYAAYHNKDIYEKYGLEIPVTWEDYFHAAEAMRGDGIYVLGGVRKHVMFLLISHYEQTTGKQVFSDDGEFMLDEQEIQELLLFYEKLLDEKVLMPSSMFERNVFTRGEVATSVAWITDAGNYCNPLKEQGTEIGISGIPSVEEALLPGKYLKPASMYAISKNTEHPKEAGRLLRFLVADSDMAELQGLEKGVPANKNAMRALKNSKMKDDLQYLAYQETMENREDMRLIVPCMEQEDMIDVFMVTAEAYLNDKQSLEDCAAEIKAAVDDCIKK